MVFQALELTTALRPELVHEESLLFVQDNTGLYEGKYKLPAYQDGHVYLTSHRICYVDNTDARKNSIAVELRDLHNDRFDYYAGFLKSSPKVTVYPKPSKRLSGLIAQVDRLGLSPPRSSTSSPGPGISRAHTPVPTPAKLSVTWICPICSFSNLLPPSFDATTANEHTPLPPCQTCGIKPPLAKLLQAAISAAAQRPIGAVQMSSSNQPRSATPSLTQAVSSSKESSVQCPRCTFSNHPSLLACEICGASLIAPNRGTEVHQPRPPSPGPVLERPEILHAVHQESIKISFRDGGSQVFFERLKGAMKQRAWLSYNAPPISQAIGESLTHVSGLGTPESANKKAGIAGLEALGAMRRTNNENVITSSFKDLEALMASAKDLIELAESLAEKTPGMSVETLLSNSSESLEMSVTKDKLSSDALYLSQLARTLAEYLTNDKIGILKSEGGIMTLVDLWAKYNRKKHGVELVSPRDFEKASRLWEPLGLKIRLREFKNGLLAVQGHEWNDSKIIAEFLAWFQEFRMCNPVRPVAWDWRVFGRGITAQEAASRFGWSIGIAIEELEMAEDKGILCREETAEGVKFWENWIKGSEDDI